MNSCLKLAPAPLVEQTPTPITACFSGEISGFDSATQQWLVDDAFSAQCALSLLMQPNIGDRVLFIEVEGQYFITQLLSRLAKDSELVMQSQRKVQWIAPKLSFTAFDKLELVSLNKVALMGKDCVMSASNAFIQQAQNMIQQLGQLSINTKGLMKLTGKQQVIIAEKDIRIDGERINMG